MRGTKPFSTVTLDTSSTNITSSFATLVASLGADCAAIQFASSVAMQVILGIGPSGSETSLVAIAPGTVQTPRVDILIPKGCRISIKSLSGSTISSGVLGITFLN